MISLGIRPITKNRIPPLAEPRDIADSDRYDFFVSYARADNTAGWISRFIEALQEEQRRFTGDRQFSVFFDTEEIHSLDDWRMRIHESLAASRLMVAFISPGYFASEWCRREWRTWIDVEIAKHVLSDGAAPIYIVEVPWLATSMTDQQVATEIAQLMKPPGTAPADGVVRDAVAVSREVTQRQLTAVQDFYTGGIEALRREDLRKVLAELAKNLATRSEHVDAAARSRSTIPLYNRRFVGRLDELLLLRERLHQGRTGVISGHKGDLPEDKSVVASVQGLGGIGKTELAFTYAHAFAGLYPGGRFYVPCEGRADIRLTLLALDEIFGDQVSDEQRKRLETHFGALREGLRRRLQELGPILLVLDNVTDPALLSPEQTDLVRVLGPKLHLLATTRLGAPEGGGLYEDVHWLTLGEISQDESVRLLEKHRAFSTPEEETAARRIARRLGGFALCVEVVGAYLGQHPEQNYAGFLETMGLSDLEPVDRVAERRDVSTRRHNNEKRLGAILAPALASLSAEARTALEFAALLPPDHVVKPWLRQLVGGQHAPISSDDAAWDHVVAELIGLALLTRGRDAEDAAAGNFQTPPIFRCHRLVQDFLRSGFTPDQQARCQAAVDALIMGRDAALKATIRLDEARWELEPLDALAQLWDETDHALAAWLLNLAGFYWNALANWNRTEPLFRRALAIYEQNLGKDHPDVATCLNNVGQLLQSTNRLTEAESVYRRALTIYEQNLGKEHPTLATCLNNLAVLLKSTNRLTEAESLYRRALTIHEQSLGKEHPTVAADLNNLAALLQATNRLAEAEPLMRRALAIREQSLGYEHPAVSPCLNNLAQLLQATNRLAEAEPLMRRALAIHEQSLGKDHSKVATCLHNLATLLHATNRLAEAEPLMRRALAIHEQSLSKDHPDVATCLNNLAQLLKDTNRLAEAEPLMRRALAIHEQSLGKDHPTVATNRNNLAALLQDTNRLAEAESLTRRALAIHEKSLGRDHPFVATDLNNLAVFLKDTNRLAEAESLMRRALAIDEQSLGKEHPDVATDLNNLAFLLRDTNRLAEAEPLMRRALAIHEQNLGKDHPDVATDLNYLALCLKDTNRLAEAESLMRRALAIHEKSLGRDHPFVATDLNNLAVLLEDTKRLAEAEPLMRRMVELLLHCGKRAGHPHPHMRAGAANYAGLLQKMGRSQQDINIQLNNLGQPFGIQLTQKKWWQFRK